MTKFLKFPFNRIVRHPNLPSNQIVNDPRKRDLFSSNVKYLVDKKTDRKVILVGTFNCSNILAERTKSILELSNPDQILIEADRKWFDSVSNMAKGRKPTNHEIQQLHNGFNFSVEEYDNNLRGLIFKAKFYSWLVLAQQIFPLQDEKSNAYLPGLEAFAAADWARKNHKDVLFAGKFFNHSVMEALKNEKRMHLIPVFLRSMFGKDTSIWNAEYKSQTDVCSVHGVEAFTETADEFRINWLIKFMSLIIPHQKKILVDEEDERLFNLIYEKMTGKVNVAIVNAWHLPGIENYWINATGEKPYFEPINPIGDLDINSIHHAKEFNDFLRRDKSKASNSEPAVTSDYLTQYNKQNTEAERERHVFFLGYDDPELEHGLYNDENKHVKNMPYKIEHH